MISVHTAAIIGVEDRKLGVLAIPSKFSNVLFLEQIAPPLTRVQIYAALILNFRIWLIVLRLYLSAF